MTRNSYLEKFSHISNLFSNREQEKEKAERINRLRTSVDTTTRSLQSTLKCAAVFRELFPENTEISSGYYDLCNNACSLKDTYCSLFGNNLETLSRIENPEDLSNKNDSLSNKAQELSNQLNVAYNGIITEIEKSQQIYNKLLSFNLIDSSHQKSYSQTLSNINKFFNNFKTTTNGFTYIRATGIIEVVNLGKQLLTEFNDVKEDLYDLQSQTPVLSNDADDLVTKLSEKRVLLRDIDLKLLEEIKNNRPDLCPKIMIKMI